ncbi:unnamed protein product [Pocillopora meandrina]|uniref:Biogenesis of lysosome-related organelles complex 1 subunit 3 n=1 Tax=Pocillopora meandrina TaxID=46732 RepID=A0AAU9WP58_9CNID|nr:unnamed protein product [Pocillopora meandrina]
MRNTMVSSTMVSGEASETDDEDDENEENPGNMKEDEDLATEDKHLKEEGDADTDILESEQDTSAGKAKRQKIVYKFDSPFHRKLRERNLELRSDLVEGLTKSYKSAGSKLESSTFHLSRAQTAALDVSHNTRMMLEDLTTISTLLESILGTGKLLPLKVTVNYK